MRSTLAAVLFVLCMMTPASAAKCEYTRSTFIEQQKAGFQIWSVSHRGQAAIIAKMNELLAEKGKSELGADEVMFGLFEHNGQLLAAVMFFKDGCYIPGSSLILPANYWAQALSALGLTDDDFQVLQGT